MISFVYTAKTIEGQLVTGEINAPDANTVARMLNERQLYPMRIEAKKSSNILNLSFFEGVSTKDKALIIRQFSTLIIAGLPVAQALQVLIKQIDKPHLQKIFIKILKDIENGSSLSEAFSRFPKVFLTTDISLIKSGEASGTLDVVLKRMAKQLEKEQALHSKIKSAMIYPSFVVVVVIGVIAIMLMYVMPKLSSLYAGYKGKLPAITQLMLDLSNFLIHSWWMIIIGLVLLAVSGRAFINTPNGRYMWDQTKLAIPGNFSKIYKNAWHLNGSRSTGFGLSNDCLQVLRQCNL
ncbi:MAG: hypothetical protein UT60_C0007G0009 [candidate division CPR2 bacterium GW2011_GWD2_39_7]|nr:MAG: hypothetical protein UT60_C0007G0009 [candidate division CPR2 bacterium GW2011_GWD2_39_7]